MGIYNKHNDSDVEILDACEVEDEGFSEGDITSDKTIATFNFSASKTMKNTGADQKKKFK